MATGTIGRPKAARAARASDSADVRGCVRHSIIAAGRWKARTISTTGPTCSTSSGPVPVTIRQTVAALIAKFMIGWLCGGVSSATHSAPLPRIAASAASIFFSPMASTAGAGCGRRFDHSTQVCCGSRSRMALRFPAMDACTASDLAVVDLATPPLRPRMAITSMRYTRVAVQRYAVVALSLSPVPGSTDDQNYARSDLGQADAQFHLQTD